MSSSDVDTFIGNVDPDLLYPQPYYESNQPRALIQFPLDWGYPVVPFEYTLTLAVHGAADTATIIIPNKGNPDWTKILERTVNTGQFPVYVKIYSGIVHGTEIPTYNNLSLRFYGVVDQYEIEAGPPNDWTVMHCRSLAAPLIDTKIVVPLSSTVKTTDFITQQCSRFSMPTPVFNLLPQQTALTMLQVLQHEFVGGVHAFSIWEVFVRCSLADDCDIWVDTIGRVHYEARARQTRHNIQVLWGRDIEGGMKLTHSPQYSRDIQVDIKIYNPQTKTSTIQRAVLSPDGSSINLISGTRTVTTAKVFGTNSTVTKVISNPYAGIPGGANLPSLVSGVVTTAPTASGGFNASAARGKVAGDSGKERYDLWLEGPVEPADALLQAQRMYLDISQHEYSIELELPITETLLNQFNQIAIASQSTYSSLGQNQITGGAPDAGGLAIPSIVDVNLQLQNIPYYHFNGNYWPREVVEHYGVQEHGFSWTVHAVNHQPSQGIGH